MDYGTNAAAEVNPSDAEAQQKAAESPPQRSFLYLLAITGFYVPYGALCTTMGLIVLNKEAENLFPADPAMALGFFMAVVGITQLVCPFAGLASDRCTSPYGRRRPFILWGTVCSLISINGMALSSFYLWPWAFTLSLTSIMVSINVVYSGATGLTTDLVHEGQRGAASGIVSVMTLLGSILGFIFVNYTSHWSYRWCYAMYNVTFLLFVPINLVAAVEIPRRPLGPDDDLTWKIVLNSYTVSSKPEGEKGRFDFYWVFMGRTMFYIAVSAQAFMQWYLRDQIGVSNDSDQRKAMSYIVIIGQGLGASVAYPAGQLSDRVGRKPLVYAACFVMCLVYVSFLFAPSVSDPLTFIYVVTAFYGMGNGCYLSVDLALAMDCVPNPDDKAKDLGVWGVAAFIGTAVGPVCWATGYTIVGRTPDKEHYESAGYVIMLIGGCVAAILAGLLIKGVEGTD